MEETMDPYDWEEEESHDGSGRPAEVRLAINLLSGTVIFNFIKVFVLWSQFGLELFIANRAAWIRPIELAVSAVMIGLTWMGIGWARTLVLAAIAWDVLGVLTAAGMLFAIGGSRLLGMLAWVNVVIELYAAYLLLQDDSLEWFRKG